MGISRSTSVWISGPSRSAAIAGLLLGAAQWICAAPTNDLFASPAWLAGTNITVAGSNVDATRESGEPAHAGNLGGQSVWWAWTAPGEGETEILTDGSGFDTLLAVYEGAALTTLVELASNDDHDGDTFSRVRFAVASNSIYRIAVDGYQSDGGLVDEGSISLDLVFRPGPITRPGNDDFAAAVAITGMFFTVQSSNTDALREPGEPLHATTDAGGDASVWWRWTATAPGQVRLDTRNSDFDTLLAVYHGTVLTALVEIVANDDIDALGGIRQSEVLFSVTSGVSYAIAVDGYDGAMGTVDLRMAWTRVPWTVASAYGSPAPGIGLHTNDWGAILTNTCNGAVGGATTQFVCKGWALAGVSDTAGQASGPGTNVVFALTNAAALTWEWKTNLWLDVQAQAHGAATPAPGWQGYGSNVVVMALPDAYYHFTGWSGTGTNLLADAAAGAAIATATVTRTATLTAGFEVDRTTGNVPVTWLVQHGFTSNFSTVAEADTDHDGLLTWQEFYTNTDPTNRQSVLSIISVLPGGADHTISWTGGTNVQQVLSWSTTLASETWSPLMTNAPPTPATTSYTHQASGISPAFYRLSVPGPD